jgi:hypothetical protein
LCLNTFYAASSNFFETKKRSHINDFAFGM